MKYIITYFILAFISFFISLVTIAIMGVTWSGPSMLEEYIVTTSILWGINTIRLVYMFVTKAKRV